ncbi:inactive purple acid phosphatase-like protein [Artemisia annua]|uniref:Inactive purple acid phosphatase-like protein n=1 Tax=Artemisia annua TaxID=35608 RepID=A0A2U1MZU0_ARTAN|nr:inactive purple acid phosphatase-like protein [Artemisia annua]
MSYANGYLSQWDQFTTQVECIALVKPYMVVRYLTNYGMFHFCIADSEHDWREGSDQYKWIEKYLASVDKNKHPWMIFAAHHVLRYSSNSWYAQEGSFEEPMGREHLQKLWQKYKVDITFYGHVHNIQDNIVIPKTIWSSLFEACYASTAAKISSFSYSTSYPYMKSKLVLFHDASQMFQIQVNEALLDEPVRKEPWMTIGWTWVRRFLAQSLVGDAGLATHWRRCLVVFPVGPRRLPPAITKAWLFFCEATLSGGDDTPGATVACRRRWDGSVAMGSFDSTYLWYIEGNTAEAKYSRFCL